MVEASGLLTELQSASSLENLTSPNRFKYTHTLEEAIDIIKAESGKQFDPKCVEALLECLNEVRMVLKDNGNRR